MTYRIAWDAATELAPDIIDGHKSFHGKAYTRHGSALTLECEYVTVRELYSYGSKVAAIYKYADDDPIIIIGRPYLFSATTSRHFRCFTRRNANGIAYGIKDIRKAWENGADMLNNNLVDAYTWDAAFADSKGYRF